MKLKYFQVLILSLLILSCKPRKNSTETTTTDSAKNTNVKDVLTSSQATGWQTKDRDDFIDECAKKASEKLSASDAITYCRCMQQSLEQKYPDIKVASGVSNTEMAGFKDDCLEKHNLKVSGSTPDDDDNSGGTAYDNNSSASWTAVEKKEFMDNCTPRLVSQLGAGKANSYCECMLEKIMERAPLSKDAQNIPKTQMTAWATDCLR